MSRSVTVAVAKCLPMVYRRADVMHLSAVPTPLILRPLYDKRFEIG